MNNVSNKHNQYIGYRVYDAQRSIAKSLEVALKPYGITPGQWNLLNQLDRMGNLTQKGLADRTRKEQATITRYLDKLERKGYIEREPDPHDRRAHIIVLTDAAKALLKKTEPAANEAALCLIEGIPQEDIDSFLTVLQALQQNAESIIENGSSDK